MSRCPAEVVVVRRKVDDEGNPVERTIGVARCTWHVGHASDGSHPFAYHVGAQAYVIQAGKRVRVGRIPNNTHIVWRDGQSPVVLPEEEP